MWESNYLQKIDENLIFNLNDAETCYKKETHLKELQKYEEALECFDKALKLDPNYYEAQKAKEKIILFKFWFFQK